MAELIIRLANGLLLLVVSRALGAASAGVYTLAFSYTLMATRMTFWGLDQLLIRQTAKQPEDIHRYFNNFLSLRGILSGVAWLLLLGVAFWGVPADRPETRYMVLIVGLSVFSESIRNLCEAVLIVSQRMAWLAVSRLIVTVARIAGTAAVIWMGYGIAGVAWVIFWTSVVGMALTLALIWKRPVRFALKVERHFWAQQLKIAWPLILGNAVYIFDNRLDIIVLSFFLSEADIGIFNAASTVVASLLIVPQAYQMAVFPVMARLYAVSQEQLGKLYGYSLKYMLIVALPLAVVLTSAADSVIGLFGRDFVVATPLMRVMVWSLPLLFVNIPMARLLVAVDKQVVVARSLTVRLVVGVALALLLVPKFGVWGVVWARLFSTGLLVIQNFVFVQRRVHSVPYSRTWLSLAIATMGMFVTLAALRTLSLWSMVPSLLVYLIVLWWSGGFSEDEKSVFRAIRASVTLRLQRSWSKLSG